MPWLILEGGSALLCVCVCALGFALRLAWKSDRFCFADSAEVGIRVTLPPTIMEADRRILEAYFISR